MGGKVLNENYVVIQGWMINDLKLKGNELIIFGIIYGFSQYEGQVYNGSLQYLADWTNTSKRTVLNSLQSLVEKGYIEKNEKFINGVKFCEYYVKNFTGVVKKFHGGGEKISLGGSEKISPNNISLDNTNNNNINNKKNKKFLSPLVEFKNVLLTEEELNKLKNNVPKYQEKIEDLSIYLENNPKKKYTSHYATILSWYRRDEKNKSNVSNSYKRKEIVPDWFNKRVEDEPASEEQQAELNELLKEFKDPNFEKEKAELEKLLKENY